MHFSKAKIVQILLATEIKALRLNSLPRNFLHNEIYKLEIITSLSLFMPQKRALLSHSIRVLQQHSYFLIMGFKFQGRKLIKYSPFLIKIKIISMPNEQKCICGSNCISFREDNFCTRIAYCSILYSNMLRLITVLGD